MSNVFVSMKLTPRQSGALYVKSMRLEDEIKQLKAQVEQLREFAALIFEWKEYGFEKAKTLLDSTPAQCLAEIKAQAVEDALKYANENCQTYLDVDFYAQEYANQLRQQAKDGE